MKTKTFNVALDQELNGLAIAFVNGDIEAGERYMEIVKPLMERLAFKNKRFMEVEDLAQEFMIVAVEKAYDFVERYNDGTNNVLGLVYKQCKNRIIDLSKARGAEKRSKYTTTSLDTSAGKKSERMANGTSFSEKVAVDQKSVEEIVNDKLKEEILSQIVEQFVGSIKGRNKLIVPLLYKASQGDWENELLNDEISKVLEAETGVVPNYDAIRKAKSRATKALRDFIESEKFSVVSQLGVEL